MLFFRNYKKWTFKDQETKILLQNLQKKIYRFLYLYAYKKNINDKIIQFIKEGLGIRSTARILKISTTTLFKRIVSVAKNISLPTLSIGEIYEMDELRFFIKNKDNTIWLAYTINKNTKEIANFHIGKRNNKTLKTVIKTL